ncbi:MAG: hypothetical protein Q9202_007017 [Teloschistes flavicans]
MDPFSVTVGLLAVVGLVAETIKITTVYLQKAKHSRSHASQLLAELKIVESSLSKLESLFGAEALDKLPKDSVLITGALACKTRLDTLCNRISEAASRPLNALLWPLKEKEHRETLQDLRNLAQWIEFSINIDGYSLLAKSSCQVTELLSSQLHAVHFLDQISDEVKSTRQTVSDIHKAMVTSEAATASDKILNWISDLEPEQKYFDILRPHVDGTGEWLLQDPTFQVWRDHTSEQASFIWCYGIQGTGKSVLASLVVKSLLPLRTSGRVAIAHYFFDYKNHAQQSLERVTASLLKQIASAGSELPAAVKDLYQRFHSQQHYPRQSDMAEVLITCCQAYQRVYFILDALDECEIAVRKGLLSLLDDLPACSATLVTSRPFQADVEKAFERRSSIQIAARSSDLRHYILREIEQNFGCDEIDSDFGEEIAQRIIERAQLMFLLAVLHTQTVLSEPTKGEMLEALVRLPEALDAAFEETMQRIKGQRKGWCVLALRCLMWISHARRPLTIEELRDALAMMSMGSGATHMDENYRPCQRAMVNSCQGLVTVDAESQIIRLAHYSVQEYLTNRDKEAFSEDEALIARLCIQYQKLPQNCQIDEATHMGTTALINAASCGHNDLVNLLLSMGADPKKKNWYGTALHCAAEADQVQAIHTLCEVHVDVDILDDHGRTPLFCAAESGHIDALRALLGRGANVDSYCCGRGSVLHEAILQGAMVDVIHILLAYHANPNILDAEGLSPLHRIARRDEAEQVVQMLLKYGADVNGHGKDGSTPLQHAALADNTGLVRLYLDSGADVNAQDKHGTTALHAAVFMDNLEMVDLLLERKAVPGLLDAGANSRTRTNNRVSPLDLAIALDRKAAYRLLLRRSGEYHTDATDEGAEDTSFKS